MLNYLSYHDCSANRKKITDFIVFLSKSLVEYPLEFTKFHQKTLYAHLISNLVVTSQKGRGNISQISFFCHPLVFYNFMKNNILVSNRMKNSYYSFVKKIYNSGALPDYADVLFFGLFLACRLNDTEMLKDVLKSRNLRKKKSQEKFV